MSCRRNPCSEYFNRFLATRMFSRVVSIQKFFNNGCVRVTPMLPNELSNGSPLFPYVSEILPLKVYCSPDNGSSPVRPELNEFSSDTVAGVGLVVNVLKRLGETS
jgi:hypothetical protein